MKLLLQIAIGMVFLAASVHAQNEKFSTGPVFEDFGPVANVDNELIIPDGAKMRISFDVSKGADAGELNRTLVSAARFINMHARTGVPVEDIDAAVVVHGKAVYDVSKAARYADAIGGENANAALIEALTGKGVRIIVCGQSAAYYEVANDDLLPGVEMAISAMTAHVLLQQEGYAINPF
ncbi:DsrE family protein [Hyphococcus flavus]|uniref:DsrE family protein n=1 Tax=Hyphococcus flavus TaxID=1866326 RepID=A0AAF0CED8_9PROT|nr:DsrE family protein [Hyphococcus flavus]WDI30014.1 DsrE family protein [Hyphococcus flavus]